ncbi:hypothetical protein SAMN05421823_101139 [Catalinimonas alkaloidigena]|uniref:DNA polymerase III, psi subunit n=1 Tax=Catalinimonas alkaloidigena TaxID=1075417 RepID=A0A1G8WNR7_9BACT|nr:hypothetical protein [Catalinimonas alkaloidigena]SDJ79904.1 hypothetical protein SAMN05421823_101139 [Catalinimonas alkaloidigena]
MNDEQRAQLKFLAGFLGEQIYVVPNEAEPEPIQVAPRPPVTPTAPQRSALPTPVLQTDAPAPEAPTQPTTEPDVEATLPPPDPQPEPATPDHIRFHIEGQNPRQVLVVVDQIDTDGRQLLEKILSAVGLTFDDIALVSCQAQPISWEPLAQRLHPRRILCFGSQSWLRPSVPGSTYQLIPSEKVAFLFVDSLGDIAASTARKKMLWRELKQMFPH